MTAVHPDARRRGIARLLKVELARRARAAGCAGSRPTTTARTSGSAGLNESLGYVYDPPYVVLRRAAARAEPDPASSG